MAYDTFTLEQLKRDFELSVVETTDAFADVAPVSVSAQLRDALADGAPLAIAIATASHNVWPSSSPPRSSTRAAGARALPCTAR